MGCYSRIVRYRRKVNAWGAREQCHLYEHPWIFKINYTGEHRSSCYLLEAIRIEFCGTRSPQISRCPASSSAGYHVLWYILVALKTGGMVSDRFLQERQIYGFHQLLPEEPPDHQEGTGEMLVEVLSACLPGSNSSFQVLMANDLIILAAFQVGSQVWVPGLLGSVLRCLTL